MGCPSHAKNNLELPFDRPCDLVDIIFDFLNVLFEISDIYALLVGTFGDFSFDVVCSVSDLFHGLA